MNIDKLIQVSVVLAFMAAVTGQLSKIIFMLQKTQYALIKDSQSSKWGTLPIPR